MAAKITSRHDLHLPDASRSPAGRGPGSCPICGMALEPELVTADSGPSPELIDMTRRFWIALALTIPVFLLEMIPHLTGINWLVPPRYSGGCNSSSPRPWCCGRAGRSSSAAGPRSTRNLNMFTLIAMGTGVAWALQRGRTAGPLRSSPGVPRPSRHVALYFEAAAVITVLVLLGQVLELRAREQTSGAIKALLNLAPKTGTQAPDEDGSEEDVAVDAIAVGDKLRVRPGEKVPVDGAVIEGRSSSR
jgi:Cu+-exporting ATPase